MKAKLQLLLLLLLTITTLRAQSVSEPCVVVEQTNGTVTEYLLSSEPRITFASGVVTLTSTTATLELPTADVDRVYLKTHSGVEAIPEAIVRIAVRANVVDMTGLEPGSPVALYSIDGRMLQQAVAMPDGTLSLSLDAEGIIIVKTKYQSFKIISRK